MNRSQSLLLLELGTGEHRLIGALSEPQIMYLCEFYPRRHRRRLSCLLRRIRPRLFSHFPIIIDLAGQPRGRRPASPRFSTPSSPRIATRTLGALGLSPLLTWRMLKGRPLSVFGTDHRADG